MQNRKCFFGAANGYSGFRSNFDRIFAYPKVEKLFIIKGGPGTGKSTLMRKIEQRYRDRFDTTVILCSSDPASLDGVLISAGDRTVGIIDGTAPHVMEAKYPGAVEELIDLGEAFDIRALVKNKTEIITEADTKKRHYIRAYNSLRLAGEIHGYIRDNLFNKECYSEAERLLSSVIEDEKTDEKRCETSPFLIGSFSKNGYAYTQEYPGNKRSISISNDGIIGYLLMSEIAEIFRKRHVGFTAFSSAFSTDFIDMIKTDRGVYSLSNAQKCDLDLESLKKKLDGYDEYKTTYDHYIEAAQASLNMASVSHFKLESIYSSSIDFTKNERRYEQAVKSIDEVLINNVD